MRHLAGTFAVGLAAALAVLGVVPPAAVAADTHAEFVSEANDVCVDLNRRGKRIARKVPPGDDRFAEKLIELSRFNKALGKTIKRLRRIEPAPGFEQPVDSWLDGLRKQRRLSDRYVRSVKRGRRKAALVALRRGSRVAEKNARKAAKLNLDDCA